MSQEIEQRLRENMKRQGARAFENGFPIEANPYLPDNPLRASFDEGWLEKQGEQKPDA